MLLLVDKVLAMVAEPDKETRGFCAILLAA